MASIHGKRIIVTGGARGIGAAAVRAFVKEGAKVVSWDVLDDLGEKVVAEANAAGPGSASYRHVDISKRDQVFAAVEESVKELGGLDALFNIAGVERKAPAEQIPEDDLDLILNVNVKGTIFTNQAVFPHLKDHGGVIVNFGSDAGLNPDPNAAHYSASKGAVMAFTRTAAWEWGPYGIRVNSVAPVIRTPMYEEYLARMSPEERAAHEQGVAHAIRLGGKPGDPDQDLAPVLVFLASDASRFITGQVIAVNGGTSYVR